MENKLIRSHIPAGLLLRTRLCDHGNQQAATYKNSEIRYNNGGLVECNRQADQYLHSWLGSLRSRRIDKEKKQQVYYQVPGMHLRAVAANKMLL